MVNTFASNINLEEIPFKSIIIMREDLSWDYKRISRLTSSAISLFTDKDFISWKEKGKIDIYTVFNMHFLEKIEYELIENGYRFEWITINKVEEGIVILPSRIYYRPYFLEDCLKLEEYSKCRLELFRETYTDVNEDRESTKN